MREVLESTRALRHRQEKLIRKVLPCLVFILKLSEYSVPGRLSKLLRPHLLLLVFLPTQSTAI